MVLAENPKGHFKKAAFEAVHYGHLCATALGTDCHALVIGPVDDPGQLGKFGAKKVIQVDYSGGFDSLVYTHIIHEVSKSLDASLIVVNHSSTGKGIVGCIGARLSAGVATGVNTPVTKTDGGIIVQKPVFSGKAFVDLKLTGTSNVLSLMGNAIQPSEVGSPCPVETMAVQYPDNKVTVVEVKTVEGTVPLPEAELVVSAGRGMKGSENWGIIEELANVLGATTACSRPVADTGWRPHHEHVGQTGIAIRPNLYIAAGISGAIQHLAGVNSSKCIVVINKDAEAPFFKAADYGVCADLFDVVPRLTESLKKFKAAQ